MKNYTVEKVIGEMESFVNAEEDAPIDQVENWAFELRNAIKEDTA